MYTFEVSNLLASSGVRHRSLMLATAWVVERFSGFLHQLADLIAFSSRLCACSMSRKLDAVDGSQEMGTKRRIRG